MGLPRGMLLTAAPGLFGSVARVVIDGEPRERVPRSEKSWLERTGRELWVGAQAGRLCHPSESARSLHPRPWVRSKPSGRGPSPAGVSCFEHRRRAGATLRVGSCTGRGMVTGWGWESRRAGGGVEIVSQAGKAGEGPFGRGVVRA